LSIRELISRFETEAEEIKEKMGALQQRAETVALMLKELKSADKGKSRRSGKAAPKKTGGRRGRKKKGGVTVRDAILATVNAASEPLPAKDIIDGAVQRSGGAVASIRTQINTLSREGLIQQVPYEGRGYRYGKPGSAPASAPAKKASAKKPRARKKAAAKKS
jgi:hypothetical protein